MIRCDALVAGAGPAGSLAALALARAGLRVVIADGTDKAHAKIGESLPAVGLRLLRSLDLDVSDFGSIHQSVGGNLTCWSSQELEAVDFFADPEGPGWRLSRRHFDQYLLNAAISAGTRYCRFNIESVERTGEGWQLRADAGDVTECTWLIEATGRSSAIARKLGVGRIRDERLVAVYGFGKPRLGQKVDRTLIEAVPEGWWYGAVLPQGMVVLAFHTDPSMARSVRQDWHKALDRTLFMREFFPPASFDKEPFVVDAGGSRLERYHGKNWLACGDAALAFDPLSSQGIYTAMYSGMSAAKAISAGSLLGDSSLASYVLALDRIRRVYRARLASAYRQVERWPGSPFWRARQISELEPATRGGGTGK